MNNKLDKVLSNARANGWYIHRVGKHTIWKHPNGGTVTTSKSPSCHRAIANIKKDFERQYKLNKDTK